MEAIQTIDQKQKREIEGTLNAGLEYANNTPKKLKDTYPELYSFLQSN